MQHPLLHLKTTFGLGLQQRLSTSSVLHLQTVLVSVMTQVHHAELSSITIDLHLSCNAQSHT